MSEEGKGEFNLMEAANEIIASDSETSSDSTQGSSAEGQAETTPEKTEGEQSLSPQDILNQVANEKPEELDQALIDQINKLGAIHNGLPVAVRSQEELKELLQKGFDYTKKSMAAAEEGRVKAEEYSQKDIKYQERETAVAQKEQELNSTIQENQAIEELLLDWRSNDPELFQHIQDAWQRKSAERERQKPVIAQYENQFKQLNDRFSQLEKGKYQDELAGIKSGWEKELSDIQTQKAAGLAKLGVKADWEKVKSAWTADSTNKMTVEDALYAVHGKDIAKANESYQKLLATKNKAQSKILGRSSVGGAQRGGETIKAPAGDYESILRQAVNQF